MNESVASTFIDSPIGILKITATFIGICSIEFTDNPEKYLNTSQKQSNGEDEINLHLTDAKQQLYEYFQGSRQEFSIPLDLHGTEFQIQVWKSLLTIPYGVRMTYMQQTKLLTDAKAIRAVANANAKNKISIVVPCHRVIGSNGNLTGYAGGLDKKKWLLQWEMKHSEEKGTLFS